MPCRVQGRTEPREGELHSAESPEALKAPSIAPGSAHPEQQPGEKWVTNSFCEVTAKRMRDQGMRIGEVAYDANGKPIPNGRPVFKKDPPSA